MPSLLYANDLVLCGLLRCVEGLKVNADKIKVMMLGGEEGLECEVLVNGMRLETMS